MADPAALLADRIGAAIVSAFGANLAGTDPVIRRSQQPQFGDYQANVAMALGKRMGRPPRDVASEIVAHLDTHGVLARVEVAGPGFVNITLEADVIAAALTEAASGQRAG